ncbi:hypothetical protein GCM10022251_41450 [Phytohabitans flavus]|uniref:Transposase IS204/IS1001/IS1096/IS1165 zinc-finger domain-containing protein n=1 Tax=Phytohabitans flavus TaxID=1076124 RepID=A0A6F8Y0G9_9ACTN|nr:hypothetical protein Pflav_060220 [Phytohabitans flavus]
MVDTFVGLADAALGGCTVVIYLLVRRLKCVSEACPAVTFVEQVEDLPRPHARRTPLLQQILAKIAVALAARPAARPSSRQRHPATARAADLTALCRASGPPPALHRRSHHAPTTTPYQG